MHELFTMIGGASRESRNRNANQRRAIRAKNRFWRATMRREPDERENFLIAKNCDSESALCAFD
jgi:hypothetical protein